MKFLIILKVLYGDIASWDQKEIWEPVGNVTSTMIDRREICSRVGSLEGILMIMPSNGNWYHGRELCSRFGGRLHIDNSLKSAQNRTVAMVEDGERIRPARCVRVWLGASDTEQEGEWRDSETGEILDIAAFWTPGQPNGARVQNCASIWEFVRFSLGMTKRYITSSGWGL